MWKPASGRARAAPRPLRSRAFLLAALLAFGSAEARADPPRPRTDTSVHRICQLIEREAERNSLSPHFFARLIWKESRFDAGAISPVGAQGIAQFMPATAKAEGLADPFNIEQAIPASARHLAELRGNLGNWGLAAAAYNAGEGRVGRWLSSGGFLPLETENYVLDILGEPADNFSDRAYQGVERPIDGATPFAQACRALPVILTRTVPMSEILRQPWGVQVAGNFRRQAAVRQWDRLKGRLGAEAASHEPVVSRIRSPRGRRGIYAVRIGAGSRKEADTICRALRQAGGACVVLRNR